MNKKNIPESGEKSACSVPEKSRGMATLFSIVLNFQQEHSLIFNLDLFIITCLFICSFHLGPTRRISQIQLHVLVFSSKVSSYKRARTNKIK
jgi:hypothetical protein